MVSKAPELPWLPTTEALSWPDRQPPESVKEFFRSVLHSTHDTPGDDVCQYVESLSQDFVYAVSRGDFLTEKHVVLGTGLYSLTGHKMPIKLLGRLGHSCTYDKVHLIETVQAELIQHLRSLQHPLPLAPASDTGKVLTYFWWDNFDIRKDNAHWSLHATHGVAYQEESVNCIKVNTETVIPKSKRRSVISQPHQLPVRKVDPRKEPVLFEQLDSMDIEKLLSEKIVFIWKILRRNFNSFHQSIPHFVCWVIQAFVRLHYKMTMITFLPSILHLITQYSTVIECIKQSQKLASASNMRLTHITVDGGAAMKFFHVVWNDEFNNVLIHLGDFHAMMEFFNTIQKFVAGSDFEEVVYQECRTLYFRWNQRCPFWETLQQKLDGA